MNVDVAAFCGKHFGRGIGAVTSEKAVLRSGVLIGKSSVSG